MGYAIWYSALPLLTSVTAATVQLAVPVINVSGIDVPGAEKQVLGFETLTFAPIERDLIEPSLLSLICRELNTVRLNQSRAEISADLLGIDIEPGCVPGESGLLGVAVSFTKGCYPGQEIVARSHYLGKVKRHQQRGGDDRTGANG